MVEKIQLRHPAGKHAVRMDIEKYKPIRAAILKCLSRKNAVTHAKLLELVLEYFKKKKIKFVGSVEWYMEGVKLDLEANHLIERFKEHGKQQFKLPGDDESLLNIF